MQIVLASRKDSLTGIANRGALLDGSKRLLERCRQEGASFSLIMFDLDHFKWVNDTYGHRCRRRGHPRLFPDHRGDPAS